jgi:hypothetical protein
VGDQTGGAIELGLNSATIIVTQVTNRLNATIDATGLPPSVGLLENAN